MYGQSTRSLMENRGSGGGGDFGSSGRKDIDEAAREHDERLGTGEGQLRDRIAKAEKERKERERRDKEGPDGFREREVEAGDMGPKDDGFIEDEPGADDMGQGSGVKPGEGGTGWYDNYEDFMNPKGSFDQWWAKGARGGIGMIEFFLPMLKAGKIPLDALGWAWPGSGGAPESWEDFENGGGSGGRRFDWEAFDRGDGNGTGFDPNDDGGVPAEYRNRWEYEHRNDGIPGGGGNGNGGSTGGNNPGDGGDPAEGDDRDPNADTTGGGGGGDELPDGSRNPYIQGGPYDYGYEAGPVRMAGQSQQPNMGGIDINALMRMLQGGG